MTAPVVGDIKHEGYYTLVMLRSVRFKRELKFVHPQVNDRLQQLLTSILCFDDGNLMIIDREILDVTVT